MPKLPSAAVVFAAACSVERTRPQARGDVAARRQRRERPDDGALLARRVLGAEAAEGGRQQAAPEAVDRGVDLSDLALFLGGQRVLDDAADPLVLVVHDALVAAGLIHVRGEDRACRVLFTVLADEGGERGRPEKRRVAREDDDVARVGV